MSQDFFQCMLAEATHTIMIHYIKIARVYRSIGLHNDLSGTLPAQSAAFRFYASQNTHNIFKIPNVDILSAYHILIPAIEQCLEEFLIVGRRKRIIFFTARCAIVIQARNKLKIFPAAPFAAVIDSLRMIGNLPWDVMYKGWFHQTTTIR